MASIPTTPAGALWRRLAQFPHLRLCLVLQDRRLPVRLCSRHHRGQMAYELRVDWAPPLRAVQLVQDRKWRWWEHDGAPPPDLLWRDESDLATHLLRLLGEDRPPAVRHVRTMAPRPRGAPRLGHAWMHTVLEGSGVPHPDADRALDDAHLRIQQAPLRTRATTLNLHLDHDQAGPAALTVHPRPR